MCWDTTMETGACDGSIGPVYTELIPASDCSNGCWKVISCIFEGTLQRSGGNHDAYTKMMWSNGTYINSYPNGPYFNAYWGSNWTDSQGNVTNIQVKGANDWGNFPLWASDPDWEPYTCHCPGPYGVWAGDPNNKKQSDIIFGLGMPVHQHVNWMIIWKYHNSNQATKLGYGQFGDHYKIRQQLISNTDSQNLRSWIWT